MNKNLVNSISKQARANVEHRVNDEHDTRWWSPELYDYEFARLLLTEVLHTVNMFDTSLIGSDYSQGLLDAQTQIENAIKIKFGVKE